MGVEGLMPLLTLTYTKKIPAAFLFTPSIVSSPSNQSNQPNLSKHIERIMKHTEFFKEQNMLFLLG
jgi:hypothetical protein